MASWVDPVTGRQVVVQNEADSTTHPSRVVPPREVGESSAVSVQGRVDPRPEFMPEILRLDDTDYIHVEDMDRELERRNAERFFVLPDGTGVLRTLKADQVDPALREISEKVDPNNNAEGKGQGESLIHVWKACGAAGIKPGLVNRKQKGARHVLSFPAVAGQSYRHGYGLRVPGGTRVVAFSTVVRGGKAIQPLLVHLDASGAAIAVAYSAPTETVPETRFRYARVGFKVPVPSLGEEERLALVDAASSRRFLAACGLEWQPAGFAVPGVSGTVIVEFSAGSALE